MGREHDRYEELAVGHVLGGLVSSDATEFRTHLMSCRDCRARVAELRGIASDLAAAERDERHRSRVKTEVPRRTELEPDEVEPWRLPSRTVGAILGGIVLVLMSLAFWNFHLRDQAATLTELTRTREAILEGLADGELATTRLAPGVSGVVVSDAVDVSLTLTGLPTIEDGSRLVVWLLGETPEDHRWRGYAPGEVSQGRIAWRTPHGDARRVVVTVEDEPVGREPTGTHLVDAELAVPARP